MLDLGAYLLGALELAAVAISLGFSAVRLRARLLPTWQSAPARLVEAITAIALLIWISELLGILQLFYSGALVAASLVLAGMVFLWTSRGGPDPDPRGRDVPPAGGAVGGTPPEEALATGRGGGSPTATGPAGRSASSHAATEPAGRGTSSLVRSENALLLVMWAVIAIVVAHWSITTQHALNRGIFNFDSLWYHLPFAVDMVQNHSVTGLDHVETVFTNWFYPQNSELLHAVGILLTGRDALSLFLNFGWLGIAFLAAWCIGRPYGRGPLTVVAAAILLECHTLVVRDPGAAKNDLAAAALILAAIAILVEAWAQRHPPLVAEVSVLMGRKPLPRLEPGWELAAAGLAVGLAAGTRVTVLAMAAALSVAVLVLAPRGRRRAAAGWWFLPALAGGGYWYLRNLIVAGNPIPEVTHLGPLSLPHPERLQEGRPNFNIVHYATDTGVWRHYFAPGLHQAFGALWPLVVFGAAAAALLALLRGRDTLVRWLGGVALFGLIAYLFTPLSAAGAEGEPVGFGINIRYVVPALLAGIVLVPLPRGLDPPRRQWWLMGALVLVLLITDRPDAVVHDEGRLFAMLVVLLAVAAPAALLLARGRGASTSALLAGFAVLALAVVALGYPAQRHYLRERFRNQVADESIPGMDLDSAYRWARDRDHSRIGLVGTTAGFAGYGFYGTDLSNQVRYLGEPGPHGAYDAIATCAAFRAAVNAAELDYLVTAPFLNFLHPDSPIASPEARWLRGEGAVTPILREGPVTVWRVRGRLDPAGCASANAPLREIPDTPRG
jgi:hypothetical protein